MSGELVEAQRQAEIAELEEQRDRFDDIIVTKLRICNIKMHAGLAVAVAQAVLLANIELLEEEEPYATVTINALKEAYDHIS